MSTPVGTGRAINKLRWDRKDGRRAAMGPINAELGRCMQARHSAWVTALADRRAAARAGS